MRPLAAMTLAAALAFAATGAQAEPQKLAKDKAERLEVRHSMVGPRDTLLFYTYPDQKVVLRLHVQGGGETFSITGTAFVFDPETSQEGLSKWLNNQHSDGLFVDPPDPILTIDLPAEACQVTRHELKDEAAHPPLDAVFKDYKVVVEVKTQNLGDLFELTGFEDEAGVYVVAGNPG